MKYLVIGSSGQDGSYIVDQLIAKNQEVLAISRNSATHFDLNRGRISILPPNLVSAHESFSFLSFFKPDVIFHFAAVHAPLMVYEETFLQKEMWLCHVSITQNTLDWIKASGRGRLVVALSSQMYSASKPADLVNESTTLNPSTYYGETKCEAFRLIVRYREKFGVESAGAILFNHTSNRSRKDFLFPTIAAEFKSALSGGKGSLTLKNPDALIDIGDASEYVSGVLKMADQQIMQDYVLSSGKLHIIREIIQKVSRFYNIEMNVAGISEISDAQNYLQGDPAKAQKNLGWKSIKEPDEILREIIESI